jgi:hypothetical protein
MGYCVDASLARNKPSKNGRRIADDALYKPYIMLFARSAYAIGPLGRRSVRH